MLYCKNCGRQLKDGARFCDRCGQSVRKTQESSQAAKQREIEELKAERLNRKKKLAEKEEKKANKKKRKNSGSGVAVFFFVIVLIAIVSMIIGFNLFSGGSSDKVSPTSTVSSAGSAATVKPSATQTTAPAGSYSEITVGNIKIPYPSTFNTNTVSGNEKLNITDPLGGANMVIGQEAKTGEPSELIKEYISSIGATNNPKMTAKGDSYSVTAQVGDKIYHRKAVVRNGLEVYYDFVYDANSSASKKYEEYISYMDSEFN